MDGDERYMAYALMEAEAARELGEVPIGAVVVDRDGAVIGRGANARETWGDPTAHAELIAIRDAARVRGDWRLYGCRLFVTVEPCMMCAGAIVLARLEEVVYGAANPKGGAIASCARLFEMPGINHAPAVKAGVMGDRCAMIMEAFFRDSRRR